MRVLSSSVYLLFVVPESVHLLIESRGTCGASSTVYRVECDVCKLVVQ